MPIRKSIKGKRFSNLFVIEHLIGGGKSRSRCLCDCGREIVVRNDHLKSGRQVSCGCVRKARMVTHGKYKTKEYGVWEAMIQRCFNKRNSQYADYGGRGITVCPEWRKSFQAFIDHVGPRPESHCIERINNDGNYEPGNVKWATRFEQSRNTRNTRIFTVDGSTACLKDLCSIFQSPYKRVESRIRLGWNVHDAIFFPKHSIKRYKRPS